MRFIKTLSLLYLYVAGSVNERKLKRGRR